jgi:hypothetical protein
MDLKNEWITGFVDGDGCFYVGPPATPTQSQRFGFIVSQSVESIAVLEGLKSKFNCGFVHRSGGKMYEYKVGSLKDLREIIVPFFLANPVQTQKRESFKKFYEALMLQPLPAQPLLSPSVSLSDDWLSGFIDAEGSFYISMSSKSSKTKDYPRPQFSIGLKLEEKPILEEIQKFVGFGSVFEKRPKKAKAYVCYLSSSQPALDAIFRVCLTSTHQCRLKTEKRHSFSRFYRVVHMIKRNEHKTPEGIALIRKIIKA